ncbi:trace amine-associated receptor 5-like [Oculina patagonica]
MDETLLNVTSRSLNNSLTNRTISSHEQSTECLPSWILNAIGVKSVYASDIAVTVVQIPFAIFAFLANLAVIATIIRTPSLQIPVNVLLCSLAAADCLTGLVAQPVYVSWRVLLHHFGDPCRLVHLYQASKSLPFLFIGCTFLNLAITSVDRFYAVSKPLAYRIAVTFRGMVKIVVSAWVLWFIYICLLETVVPKMIYEPMENVTLALMIIIPAGGHILTFHAIRTNNRKIFSASHNLQHATFYKRQKKAARDMAFYTAATLLSLLPLMILLNFENSVFTGNVLFPWAATATALVSSINPVIQIRRNAAMREAL